MGRIEYEYPLFKVYYSNNSNNSNIRGNPGQAADSEHIKSDINREGDTANHLNRITAASSESWESCDSQKLDLDLNEAWKDSTAKTGVE